MKLLNILNRLVDNVILAVVRVETIERGYEIADGCLEGGVEVLEISYTNNNAGEVINQLKARYTNELLVGAGTILDSETARHAILNGADFIIAPTFNEDVAKICNLYQIPYMPGCTTYTEMVTALESGASFIKAFPISNYYGPSLGSVFKTPLPQMPLMSSGGATIENVQEWLSNGIEIIGVGSLLTKGSKDEIAANAAKLVAEVQNFKEKR